MIELLGVAAVAACLVAASTTAADAWGHRVGGVVSAFPLIVGPALLLAALRQDAAFAAAMATATLLGIVALSGFVLVYGRAAARCGWPLSLGLAWVAAAGLGTLAGGIGGGLLGGLLAAIVSATLARAALPRGRRVAVRVRFPRWELPARIAVTALLIVGLTVAGERFGPTVAGVLAALPTLASVLAVFTHARHGHDALLALLRGMLGGLGAFVSFCALIALLIVPPGVATAFVVATGAALPVQLLVASHDRGLVASSTCIAAAILGASLRGGQRLGFGVASMYGGSSDRRVRAGPDGRFELRASDPARRHGAAAARRVPRAERARRRAEPG